MPLKQTELAREPVIYDIDSLMNFGKYKGMTVREVLEEDPKYLVWAYENIEWFDLDVEVATLADSKIKHEPWFFGEWDEPPYDEPF